MGAGDGARPLQRRMYPEGADLVVVVEFGSVRAVRLGIHVTNDLERARAWPGQRSRTAQHAR